MRINTAICMTLLVTLLGCSKLTLENYNKLEQGMSYDEVTKLIGQPNKCDDILGLRSCTWGDERVSISVTFAGDKVMIYSSTNLK